MGSPALCAREKSHKQLLDQLNVSSELAGTRHSNYGERVMNWDRIEGNWKQVAAKVKEQWGKLTDDDLTTIEGRRDQLEGKIQQRYGYAKDQVRKDVDTWFDSLK